jgi:hypothetical protein
VSAVCPTQSGSSAAYPPATKSAHGAVSQTQPGDSIALFPQARVSGPKKLKVVKIDAQHRVLSSKTVEGVRKRHVQPASNATMPLRKIIDHTRPTQNNLTSLESAPPANKVDDGVLKMFFKCMEELKAIKNICVSSKTKSKEII